MKKVNFGAFESKKDERTVRNEDVSKGGALPISDVKIFSLPHVNQNKVGICTACAVVQVAEKELWDDGFRGSIEWLYKMGKVLVDKNMTEGSSALTMLKTAQKYGIPSEEKFPSNTNRSYSDFMKDTNITEAMLADAALHKIPGYAAVGLNEGDLMSAIFSSKGGLVTRMTTGAQWYTDINGNVSWNKKDIEPLRATTQSQGGHLIAQVGYDSSKGLYLKDRNSWGDVWCDKGDVHMFYETIKRDFTEAWRILPFTPDISFLFTKVLRYGDKNDDVYQLQKLLGFYGFFPWYIPKTKYFGKITANAVKKMQLANGLLDFENETDMTKIIFGLKSIKVANILLKIKQ